MKVALIADVHGNLPALDAVLTDALRREVQAVWNLGDFVGYGPWPEEAVELLRCEQALHVLGNYDRKVLRFPAKRKKWRRTKDPRKFLSFQFAWDRLSQRSREFLAGLPEQRRLVCQGRAVLLCHGSPASRSEPLNLDTPRRRLEALAELAEADVVCCGHSHEPFVRHAGRTLFINPGSVGRPEGNDPRTVYALVDFSAGEIAVRHRRLEYDVARCVRRIRQAGLPEAFADMLRKGRNLQQLTEAPHPASAPEADDAGGELAAATALGRRLRYDEPHAVQVGRLALAIFDELGALHGYGPTERRWLHVAALLHDIGWAEGAKGHHKTAMRLILAAEELPLRPIERQIVACIARYHRKALPKPGHDPYASLGGGDRRRVEWLGGMLRLADGLDRSHLADVRDVRCRVGADELLIRCRTSGPAGLERAAAERKSDLLASVIDRPVRVEVLAGDEASPAAPADAPARPGASDPSETP